MINNHSVKYLSILLPLYPVDTEQFLVLAGHVDVPVPSFNIISTIQSDDKQRDLCEDYPVLVTGDWRTAAGADISGDLAWPRHILLQSGHQQSSHSATC